MGTEKFVTLKMQRSTNFLFLLLLSAVLFMASCSSAKKSNCGCPNKKGMVGY
jgi:hypothetical protein